MQSISAKKMTWKSIQNLHDASKAVDTGLLLGWSDARFVVKLLSNDDQMALVKHMAKRLLERSQDRLLAEIVIESTLVFLAVGAKESVLLGFLQELLDNPDCEQACRFLVEIAL